MHSSVTLRLCSMSLTATSSCLSILGGTLILVTYAVIPSVRNYTRTLLVYLTIADLLTAVGNFVASIRYAALDRMFLYNNETYTNCTDLASDSDTLCMGQSFVTTFSNMASFFWTFIIAFHLWSNVFLKSRISENAFIHLGFHLVSWILPFVLVSMALHKAYLGEDYCYGTGVWCGIKSSLKPEVIRTWMYIEDVGWQISCYLGTCILYIHTKFYIYMYCRNQTLNSLCPNLRNEDKNFVFIWMVIYLLKLWGCVRFFVTTYSSTSELQNERLIWFVEFLLVMQSYGSSGQAFWNCIVFCFCDDTVRTEMKSWFIKPSPEEAPLLSHTSEYSELSVNLSTI